MDWSLLKRFLTGEPKPFEPSVTPAEAQDYVDEEVVSAMIFEYLSEFRNAYSADRLASMSAVGPLQAFIGLAVRNGHLIAPTNTATEEDYHMLPNDHIDITGNSPDAHRYLLRSTHLHTRTGKRFTPIGFAWMGDIDQWGVLHHEEGRPDGTLFIRSISNFRGNHLDGTPRFSDAKLKEEVPT